MSADTPVHKEDEDGAGGKMPLLDHLIELRSRLLKSASGRVLEVAGGTGRNLGHYPTGADVITIDLSPDMLAKAR